MGKGKKKDKKKASQSHPITPSAIGDKVRAALRSIMRDWKSLRAPLVADAVTPPNAQPHLRYRVRGAESFEELQERLLQFAGRVWQFKDGLIKWLKTQPSLQIHFAENNTGRTVNGSSGPDSQWTIEEGAKLSLELMLCADLYNAFKHYDDCNRSNYQPSVASVQFQTAEVGVIGIRYDGGRKVGELLVTTPSPVGLRMEIHSGNQGVNFGDAVVVVGRAFKHWLPLIRGMGLLVPTSAVDRPILDDLRSFELELSNSEPFRPEDSAITLDELSPEQQMLARTDPKAFIASISQAQ